MVLATVAATVFLGVAVAVVPVGAAQADETSTAAVATDHVSIYAGKINDLSGAGWAPCAGAVTWSVDPGSLGALELAREVTRLNRALRTWSAATGLDFRYQGPETAAVDGAGLQVGPLDRGAPRPRHIYIAFRGSDSVPAFVNTVYGYAAPTLVDRSTRQISGGFVLIRTDRVRSAAASDPRSLRSLYVHEIGHVLGLGHAQLEANIMYPIVTDQLTLGAGDRAGVRGLLTGCPDPVAR